MLTYKQAGVNTHAADELITRLQKRCPEIGGFGGLYPLGDSFLVAGTDGVGTKLKLAFELNLHHTIGIDLVAMSVNDILTMGAKPLFFLDYFATSKLDVDQAEQVLVGILEGCRQSECVLLGGETAEMPGFYHEKEYDLAGFAVGIVSKHELIDGKNIQAGDTILAIPSSGLHSNGFSLLRRVLEIETPPFNKEVFLTPTRIYVDIINYLRKQAPIKGMAHITGGGIPGNLPRILPKGLGAILEKDSWTVPVEFQWIQQTGNIDEEEMFETFNMGIGMLVIVNAHDAQKICSTYDQIFPIGNVIEGEGIILQ